MKRLLLASFAAITLAAGSALAADLPPPYYKAPPPPAPAVNWTGCYVDGGAGYGLWNQEHTDSTLFGGVPGTTVSQTDGGHGWLGRVGAGCDYQVTPRWVVGVLGDYDFMDLRGTNSPLETLGGFPISSTEKETGAWSVGARIGYLLTPSILTYADAGYTEARFASQTLTTNLGGATGFGYPAHTYNGWFLGGGTETALAGFIPGLPTGLFLRTEYRFSTYERYDLPEIALATGASDGNFEHTRPYVQTVTTGIVWRFNWLGH